MTGLSPKHERFVCEYLIDLNATQAAIRAGYSAKTAEVQGCRMLRNVKVSAEIDKRREKLHADLELSADRVLRGLMKLAFFDVRKLFNQDGSVKTITKLDEETAAAIAAFDVEELYEHFGKGAAKEIGKVKKVRFTDRGRALELLGRHLQLFTDKIQFSGLENLADEIQKARLRAQSAGGRSKNPLPGPAVSS